MAGACGAVRTTVSPVNWVLAGRVPVSVIRLEAAVARIRTVVFPVTLNWGSTTIRSHELAVSRVGKNIASAQ